MAWDWGNAGGGALSGAAAGTQIMPGWGTAIGGAAGGLLGGLTGGKGGGPTPPDFQALAQQQNNYQTPWASLNNGQLSLGGNTGQTLGNIQANMLRASQMDPTQARDQAIGQNLSFAMSRLQPEWAQQNQQLASSSANSGIDPGTVGYNAASQDLGARQSDMFSSAFTNALNMGNQTQQTGMAQAMQPFLQNSSLINSALQRPTAPNLLGAAGMQYGADRNSEAGQQGAKGGMMSGIGGLGGGKGGGGGGKGGGGAAPDYFNPGTFGTAGGI